MPKMPETPEEVVASVAKAVGAKSDRCRSRECSATIWFFPTAAGKWAPIDPSGISHFPICPGAHRFRK